jgi:hypothetical protein
METTGRKHSLLHIPSSKAYITENLFQGKRARNQNHKNRDPGYPSVPLPVSSTAKMQTLWGAERSQNVEPS